MKKIITCLFFIIIASLTQAQDEAGGGSLDCTIGKVNYVYFNQLMSCTATSKVKIEKRNVIVTSVCGVLDTSDVKVFYALAKVIKYIPKNLDYVFENLIGFRLENTQLKIVTSEDLKPFPELVMFASVSNHIEFLEEELFKFNPKLEYVSFRANKITYIHPNVFAFIAGESGKLQQLYMDAQAINCGIGNPTTKDAIAKALTKFSGPSSLCADINSASLLYNLWFELKSQVSGGNEELETCQSNLATCTDDLASKDEENDRMLQEISGKFAQCCAEIRNLPGGPFDYC